MASAAYDRIGVGYARYRRPDSRIGAAITDALGDARSVLNVGAGTGSYEPTDRRVVAVEPSSTMVAQRPPGSAPVVCAVAEHLPIRDDAFDVALGVLTVHHWTDVDRGLAELRRVARRQVLFGFEVSTQEQLWFTGHYLPESAALEAKRAPTTAQLIDGLDGAEVLAVPVPHDCADGFLGAYWRRPEAYLDAEVRASISTFASIDPVVVDTAIERLRADLDSGAWHRAHAELLELDELDLGYRLIVAG